MPTAQLAVVAPQLLALLAKSSVLLVMSLLTELLVVDKSLGQSILSNPGKPLGGGTFLAVGCSLGCVWSLVLLGSIECNCVATHILP
jgi:hypothetical protein